MADRFMDALSFVAGQIEGLVDAAPDRISREDLKRAQNAVQDTHNRLWLSKLGVSSAGGGREDPQRP